METSQTLPANAVQVGPCLLFCGDCLDLIPSLSGLDAVITDPPYFLPATHYNVRTGIARSLSDLSILEFYFRSVFSELRKVMAPHAVLYVFCDGQSYPVFYCTAYPNFKKLRPLIWDKMVSFNGYAWRHQHEIILFAESEETKPMATGDGDVLRCRAVKIDEREHLAEKPVELLEKLVRKTVECSTVLDPFMGSGTTGIACIRTGRKFIGIEKSPEYFAVAVERIKRELAQLPLPFDQTGSNQAKAFPDVPLFPA